jgi:hypothetical protein
VAAKKCESKKIPIYDETITDKCSGEDFYEMASQG